MKYRSSKMGYQKGKLGKRTKAVLRGIDWGMFIAFCILSGHLMNNVIHEYQAKKTSISESLEPIKDLPTLVACFDSYYTFAYGKDVNISYNYATNRWLNQMEEGKVYNLSAANEMVQALKFNDQCFKVSSTVTKSPAILGQRGIAMKLRDWSNIRPRNLILYVTSEENSNGAFLGDWWDGKVYKEVIKIGSWSRIEIQPIKYHYLDENNACSHQSNNARWKGVVSQLNYSSCSKICSPMPFFDDIIPRCGWENEYLGARWCVRNIINANWWDHFAKYGYRRPCSNTEYQGYKYVEQEFASGEANEVQVYYRFAPPMMTKAHQEYLIFDIVGMIGSVGGTLGLCIGFSFSGITTAILTLIQKKT